MTIETPRLEDLVSNCTQDQLHVHSDMEGECWFLCYDDNGTGRAKYEILGKPNNYDLRLFAMAPALAREVLGLRYINDRYREQFGTL